ESPHLVPRLASCFYWSIVNHGGTADLPRFQRLFGTPTDDPKLDRLRALLFEQMHHLRSAHQAWQQYEQAVAANPACWSGGGADPLLIANRVRAMVWEHMGQLSQMDASSDDLDEKRFFD